MHDHVISLLVLLLYSTVVGASNETDLPTAFYPSQPQCRLNETRYQCTRDTVCCQTQSDALVRQLTEIKERFSGVDGVITTDYERIEGIVNAGLDDTLTTLHAQLANYTFLYPLLNASLHRLNTIFLGFGSSEELFSITRSLPHDILRTIFTPPSPGAADEGGRSEILGIKIFWELGPDQRDCVVDYLVDNSDLGEVTRTIASNMHNTTQSIHEYMSLLWTMKKIVEKLADAPKAQDCFKEIVKMQECSMCTGSAVCPAYYNTMLSQCVPYLEDLWERWDPLMGAMSQLTLRLCDNPPQEAYNETLLLSQYITSGRLHDLIYKHGVLAFMRCSQEEMTKRSAVSGRREEAMRVEPQDDLSELKSESLIDDIRLSKRDSDDIFTFPAPGDTKERQLDRCRVKLGLLFPPLDLGTNRLLNITVGSENHACWNGTAVGGYVIPHTSPILNSEEEELPPIDELDKKMCQYARTCPTERLFVPPNNSHHSPTAVQLLASLIASLYYCCC